MKKVTTLLSVLALSTALAVSSPAVAQTTESTTTETTTQTDDDDEEEDDDHGNWGLLGLLGLAGLLGRRKRDTVVPHTPTTTPLNR